MLAPFKIILLNLVF